MKIKAHNLHLLALIWILFLIILNYISVFGSTGVGVTLNFLTLVLLPGAFLYRLLSLQSDLKAVYTIALGFGYYFFINLLALLIGLTVSQVVLIALSGIAVMFIFSLIQAYEKKDEYDFSKWRELFSEKSIFLLILALGSLFAFLAINAQVDKLYGDGWFHLGIIQKISSNISLKPLNLAPVKDSGLNLVYSFPIWHILVASFAKITNLTIFTAYRQVLLPLSIISFIVWFGLIKIVFKNKAVTSVIFLIFVLIMLRDNTFGYLAALASPDSLNRLLLVPLVLALFVDYTFSEKLDVKKLAIIALLIIFLGLIHFIQLIYLVFALILFLLLSLFFKDRKVLVLRTTFLGLGIAALVLPYLLIIQRGVITNFFANNHAALINGDNFVNKNPGDTNIIYRYAIIILPLLALFMKKRRPLIIFAAIAIAAVLISWQALGLREVFLRNFGQIFVERAIANLPNFIFFGFALFWLIWGLDYLIQRLRPNIGKVLFWVLFSISLLVIFNQSLNQSVSLFLNQTIFNDHMLSLSFWFVFLAVLLLSIYFIAVKKEFDFPIVKNATSFGVLALTLFLLLASPFMGNYFKILNKNPNGSFWQNRQSNSASDISFIGGQKTIDFLNSVPSGSVFLTDNISFAQNILLYSPNFVAEYPYSVPRLEKSEKVYANITSPLERGELLKELKVDYIVIRNFENDNIFSPPEYQLVFTNDFIYQGTELQVKIYQL